MTFPVLVDANWEIASQYEIDWGIPSFHLLGPGLEVVLVDQYPSPGIIEQYLPE